jgi:MFS family permease
MLKSKILFMSLCTMGILAALLGAAQMWFDILDWNLFLKIMTTLLIVGTELSFLIAIDYDLPSSRRKMMLMGLVGVSLAAVILVLAQIWAQILAWAVFVKLIATLGIGIVLIGFLLAVAEDFGGNKRLKDNNFID